jgi:hypothetical protein
MSDNPAGVEDPGTPLDWFRRVLRSAWNDMRSVYYANSPIWRLLKSGALLFFGFFCWSGANLLLSYRPEWGVLYYVMAYGFALILWGPLTHFVVVPAVIHLRRSADSGIGQWIGRHGSKANLTVFILIVLALGSVPPGAMTFEFQAVTDGGGGGDVNPDLLCTKSNERVHCHLTESQGIDTVVVSSGGETLQTVEEPPFEFDVAVGDLQRVNGDRQFTVELQDESGNTLRRYIRRVDLIPG